MNEDVQKSRGNRLNEKREKLTKGTRKLLFLVYYLERQLLFFYVSEEFYYSSITFELVSITFGARG
ncbi:hypothetical protein A5816_000494 [Enterococcus sp. 3G1_DIV0629]|nr:hypothetical protein [Enterococcus faecium]OTO28228.1 hypothetical protein A5816_000494 [Enterococcus sp. 3G1_DIV0629]